MTTSATEPATGTARLKLSVRGAVQGVGFRPFVYRLATELGLCGWVNNSPQGVFLEVEGARAGLKQLLLRLETEKPPRSFIQSLEASWLDAVGYTEFEIRKSETVGRKFALVLPDIATCPDCLREIFDPANRRYRYPFTNCTNCGPRFSIIESLPYDRANTSMKSFPMCPACQAEYDDPRDRRFHAQPNACPVCGPQLELWERSAGTPPARPLPLARDHLALLVTVEAIRRGQIAAVKGIGGFYLMVDARNESAVRRLRERKHREEKPFALMFPSLESAKAVCEVSPLEARLLRSPEAPIVLLKRLHRPHPQEREDHPPSLIECATADTCEPVKQSETNNCCSLPINLERRPPGTARWACRFTDAPRPEAGAPFRFMGPRREQFRGILSPGERARVRAGDNQPASQIALSAAPGNPNLGVMLPSNPLHHLLLAELGFPVVATSGNLSDEPICTDEHEALERLRDIADVFLVHNRPIVRHVDDSLVRIMLDREMVLRRARGYAPLPVTLNSQLSTLNSQPVLAVGAHLKNSVALAVGEQTFLSQHIGDLETEQAHNAFRRVIADFEKLYDAKPEVIVADLHPDYLSTKFALEHRPPDWSESEATSDQRAGLETGAPLVIQVQHHIAHVLSCIAENQVGLPALGVAWDGTGYGTDGTIWGGEFFLVTDESVERIAHVRPFHLPGGDAAVKEPRRAALGLLHGLRNCDAQTLSHTRQSLGHAFSPKELAILESMLARKVNCPLTSSVGRLFDAVASLIGLRHQMRFEGQAALELEFALAGVATDEAYPTRLLSGHGNRMGTDATPFLLDWSPMIEAILADVQHGVSVGEISAKFHNALAEAIVDVAKHAGENRVVLSGGCFQNRYLTERAVTRLRQEGFQPYWHQRVPPNDGGIALGQIVAARRELAQRSADFSPLQHPNVKRADAFEISLMPELKRAEARAPLAPATVK